MEHQERKITVADPSAIGLFGLAMVTLVASSQKMGWTSGTAFIIPWALFLGAFAQLFAAILDSKKNNVFGTTAFGAYAFFWMGMAMSWLIQHGFFGVSMAQNVDVKEMGVAFVGYLIFSLYMTVAATGTNKVLLIIFICIDLLFLGLSLSTLLGSELGHHLAAYAELAIALLSFYGSAGNVLNRQFNREILPLGAPFTFFK
ncbi:GPR1/FUN34/yaaH family protein [Clostridiaceae bacterium JG1575]|nr:GPR1/FUN34/yaaH family protein [Clostridiaceae bacterium JG1575]